MPKPFSPEERNQIQLLILEKSKELFVRYGFEKITIADITEAADIGKGTFYHFYKSKGELFVDIYAREWRRLQEELLQKYEGYSGDIAEIVLSYIRDNRKNLLGSPVLSIIYQRGTLKHISDKYGTNGLKEFSELNKSILEELINSWSPGNNYELKMDSRIISGMMRSLSYLTYHRDEIGEDIFEDVINAFMESMALKIKENIVAKEQ